MANIRQQTQTCVPNNYAVPPLAPAYDEDICPHWAERWDIRTRPLGCQVSTITSLTGIISVLSTLVFLLFSFLAIRGVQRLSVFHKQHPEWWKVWAYERPAWMCPSNWRISVWNNDWERDWRQRQPLLGTWNVPPEVSHDTPHNRDPAPEEPHSGDSHTDDSDPGDDNDGDSGDSESDSDSS
jgi:hypothetical protein